jgi:hypothetical protein
MPREAVWRRSGGGKVSPRARSPPRNLQQAKKYLCLDVATSAISKTMSLSKLDIGRDQLQEEGGQTLLCGLWDEVRYAIFEVFGIHALAQRRQ